MKKVAPRRARLLSRRSKGVAVVAATTRKTTAPGPAWLARGREILLLLWIEAVEVRVGPDGGRLVIDRPERLPGELLVLAREHEEEVAAALVEAHP